MLKVVLDTNVLVSALWTPAGNASTIVSLILLNRIEAVPKCQILEQLPIKTAFLQGIARKNARVCDKTTGFGTSSIIPCFDQRILDEYRAVLSRPRFAFLPGQADGLLRELTGRGLLVTVVPSAVSMPDETDRKFFDAARFCKAYLITGNLKHYPKNSFVKSPARFLENF